MHADPKRSHSWCHSIHTFTNPSNSSIEGSQQACFAGSSTPWASAAFTCAGRYARKQIMIKCHTLCNLGAATGLPGGVALAKGERTRIRVSGYIRMRLNLCNPYVIRWGSSERSAQPMRSCCVVYTSKKASATCRSDW